MINPKSVEISSSEYIKKDITIKNSLELFESIYFQIIIGFISTLMVIILLKNLGIFAIYFMIFIITFKYLRDQKLIENYIINNLDKEKDITKVIATILKLHKQAGIISIILISLIIIITPYFFQGDILFFTYVILFSIPFGNVLRDIYLTSNPIRYSKGYIPYIYSRVKLYTENEYYQDVIDNSYARFFNKS